MSINGTYSPLQGDFNDDGIDDILWYAPGTAADPLWLAKGDRTFTTKILRISGNYPDAFVGDFNGDGADDIFWYAPGTTPDYIWFSKGDGSFRSVPRPVSGTYQAGGFFRFDHNSTDDIFWYAPGKAPDAVWRFNPDGTYVSTPVTVNGDYDLGQAADLNGDQLTDIIWWRMTTSSHPTMTATGTGGFTSGYLSGPGTYSLPIVGYYDGDDLSDIVWYGPDSAPDAIAYGAAGLGHRSATTIEGDYVPLVANWNGDNQHLEDIVWWSILDNKPDKYWQSKGSAFDRPPYNNNHIVESRHWALIGRFNSGDAYDVLYYEPGTGTDHLYWGVDSDGPAPAADPSPMADGTAFAR